MSDEITSGAPHAGAGTRGPALVQAAQRWSRWLGLAWAWSWLFGTGLCWLVPGGEHVVWGVLMLACGACLALCALLVWSVGRCVAWRLGRGTRRPVA